MKDILYEYDWFFGQSVSRRITIFENQNLTKPKEQP
jgi:hypothetical protein